MKKSNLTIAMVILMVKLSFGQLSTAEFQIAVKMNTYGDASLFLEHVQELQKKYPNDAKVVFLHGAYQYKIGKIAEASKTFSKSIEIDGTFSYPYVARATIFAQNKDLDNAIADMTTAIYWDSKNIQAREIRAQYCVEMKRYDMALEDMDAKIRLEPSNIENYILAANICSLQNENSKAESYYAKAFTGKNVNAALASIAYAKYLFQANRFTDAIIRYNDAIEADPHKLIAIDHSSLALAYMKAGDFNNAILESTKAEKMEPSNLDVKCNTASIYLAKGEWRKAKKYAQKVLDIDQKHKKGNLIMSLVETQLGNLLSAKMYAVKAEN